MDCAGGLIANLVRNLLFGVALHPQLQYLPVFLGNALLGKGGDLHFRNDFLFKLAARVGYFENIAVLIFHHFVKRNGLAGAVMMPLPHKIRLDGAAGGFVILHGAVFPDCVNHRLPVLLRNHHICDIADQIAELLIGQPRHFHTLRDVVKVLEAKPVLLKLHSDVGDNAVRQPPQREISCVLIPAAGNVAVVALAVFDLEKLPCAPCVAVPHKQLEHIVAYDVVIFVCPQDLIRTARQLIGWFPFLRKLSRQAVKQRQP